MKTQVDRKTGRTRHLRAFMLLAAAACMAMAFAGCAAFGMGRPEPVTVQQIVQMSTNGVSSAEIIRQIKASGTVYRLKASQLADLKKQGVPDEVIDYMQQTYLDAVRRDASYEEWWNWRMRDDYWYGGAPCGWPRDRVYIFREGPRERR